MCLLNEGIKTMRQDVNTIVCYLNTKTQERFLKYATKCDADNYYGGNNGEALQRYFQLVNAEIKYNLKWQYNDAKFFIYESNTENSDKAMAWLGNQTLEEYLAKKADDDDDLF